MELLTWTLSLIQPMSKSGSYMKVVGSRSRSQVWYVIPPTARLGERMSAAAATASPVHWFRLHPFSVYCLCTGQYGHALRNAVRRRAHGCDVRTLNIKRCIDEALANYWSAINRRLIIGRYWLTQKLILLSYLSYLGSDCYLRTLTYLKDCREQTKHKCTQKQSYKTEGTLMLFTFGNKNKKLYLPVV